jgi:hypothetical protein
VVVSGAGDGDPVESVGGGGGTGVESGGGTTVSTGTGGTGIESGIGNESLGGSGASDETRVSPPPQPPNGNARTTRSRKDVLFVGMMIDTL